MGISATLAAASSVPVSPPELSRPAAERLSVAERLKEVRVGVAEINAAQNRLSADGKFLIAEWVNFGGGWGWRNGGWHNGGWRNGGWGNGGWGNGGRWHNWGNGWHNWHNYWHNW